MSLLLSIDNFSSEDFDFQILKMFISGVKYLINEREQRGRNRQSGISSSFIDKKKKIRGFRGRNLSTCPQFWRRWQFSRTVTGMNR